tara:strand:+ start:1504 stop:2025 length:522 start_codon:yes stop_codon:yes gene_type:complete
MLIQGVSPVSKKLLVTVLASIFAAGFFSGFAWAKKVQAEREEQQAKADTEEVQRTADIQIKEVVKYVDRVKTITLKGDTITKEVVKYVPNSDCVVTPDAVRLLNAAAKSMSVPGDPRGVNGASAPAEGDLIHCATLARAVTVVVQNYQQYHIVAARLEALQTIIADTGKQRRE